MHNNLSKPLHSLIHLRCFRKTSIVSVSHINRPLEFLVFKKDLLFEIGEKRRGTVEDIAN